MITDCFNETDIQNARFQKRYQGKKKRLYSKPSLKCSCLKGDAENAQVYSLKAEAVEHLKCDVLKEAGAQQHQHGANGTSTTENRMKDRSKDTQSLKRSMLIS